MSSIDLTDPNFLRHHHKLTDMSLLSTLIISWNCDETNWVFYSATQSVSCEYLWPAAFLEKLTESPARRWKMEE